MDSAVAINARILTGLSHKVALLKSDANCAEASSAKIASFNLDMPRGS